MGVVVGFRMRRAPTFYSWVISTLVGPPTHVVIGDPETHYWWHAEAPDGVSVCPYNPLAEPHFEFYSVPPRLDHAVVIEYFRGQWGAGYDWFSVFFWWTGLTARSRWSCHELVANALMAGGERYTLERSASTPRSLRRALINLGYQRWERA